jgi:hypothetical protein
MEQLAERLPAVAEQALLIDGPASSANQPFDRSAGSANVAVKARDEWIEHKAIITKLYWDERRTLREVRRIMKETHAFDKT